MNSFPADQDLLGHFWNPGLPLPDRLHQLFHGLSKHSYNVVAFYEQRRFNACLAYNWRDEYPLSPIAGPNGWALYEEARGQLDASMSYALRNGITLFVDGTNLLQEEFGRFYHNSDTAAFDGFFESMNYYGRTVTAGVRFPF